MLRGQQWLVEQQAVEEEARLEYHRQQLASDEIEEVEEMADRSLLLGIMADGPAPPPSPPRACGSPSD